MKIALISPHAGNLQAMADTLAESSHEVLTFEGGKTRMRAVADEHLPDLMLVEGMCCDPQELTHVEQVTARHPQMAVVLLCANQTPEFLLQAMRNGVREVLPSPAAEEALRQMVARTAARLRSGTSQGDGKILAFMPCKGGSGATFLATNLGFHLALDSSVLLIDLNLQFGDALSLLHDRRPGSTIWDVASHINRLDASFLASACVAIHPKYAILAAPEEVSQSVEILPEHVDAILTLAVSQYEYVLLDLPRSIDPISIRALDRALRIYPVLQQNVPSVRNARQMLNAFGALGYAKDKIEMIVNRFDRSAAIGLDDIGRTLGDVTLHTVPNSFRDVNASIDQGVALETLSRSSPVARTIADIARTLRPRAEEDRGGLFGRLLRRA